MDWAPVIWLVDALQLRRRRPLLAGTAVVLAVLLIGFASGRAIAGFAGWAFMILSQAWHIASIVRYRHLREVHVTCYVAAAALSAWYAFVFSHEMATDPASWTADLLLTIFTHSVLLFPVALVLGYLKSYHRLITATRPSMRIRDPDRGLETIV